MDPMFPQLPGDLAALGDEQIGELIGQYTEIVKKIGDRDPDIVGERTQEETIEEARAGVEKIKEMQAELDARAEAEATFAADLSKLMSEVIPDGATLETTEEESEGENGETDGEGEGEEGPEEAEAAAKPVVAASRPLRRPLPAATARQRPTPVQDDRPHLRASSAVADLVTPGTPLDGKELGRVLYDIVRARRVQPGMALRVASATFQYPDDRILDSKNGILNMDKITVAQQDIKQRSSDVQALVASGGLCNPLTPIYELPSVESAARPVRDALVNFNATRGGVQVGANPIITDYAEAVGVIDAEEDLGGTVTKNCMRIECPVFSEVEVASIYRCIEAGNLTARAYPEVMTRIDTLVRANHAREADGYLLDLIKAGSTAVTDVNTTSTASAIWKLIEFVHVSAAAMRSRHRMSPGTTLRALFPEWILDELVVDSARNGNDSDRFKTRDQLASILSRAGIAISFYMDSSLAGGQVFAAQTAGNLLGFPATVEWALYPEGSWLHLDSGSLDLGVVRDSILNSTNDFQIFAETWESAAFVGVESQWHTATLAPNGTFSAPKDYSASTNF